MNLLTARISGLVHVILFASIRRILPPRSMFPRFLISNPKVLHSSTDVADSDFEPYYGEVITKQPKHADAEKKQEAHRNEHDAALQSSAISGTIPDPRDPFVDPVPLPIEEEEEGEEEEGIIKRVDSPDSEYGPENPLPHHGLRTRSPVALDYVDRSLMTEQAMTGSPAPAFAQGKQTRPSEQGPARTQPTHREGEELEVPMSARSTILRYYEGLEL
jgi:hypothetical protein